MFKMGDTNNNQKVSGEANEDFDCPFPLIYCPYEKEMMERTRRWAKRFKLIQTKENEDEFERDRIPLFGTCSYPEAEGDRLFAAVLFVYWFFLYDDFCEDAAETSDLKHLRQFSDKFAEMMVNPPKSTEGLTPLEISFLDFMDLCRRLTSETWVRRFQTSWNKWNVAVIRERELKEAKITPSLKEYINDQCHTCGDDVMFDIVELAYNIYLPEEVAYSKVMEDIRTCGAKILRYSNDIYSYQKEQDTGSGNNIVAVLISECGLSKDDAIGKAIQMYNEQVREMLRLEKTIPSYGPETDQIIKSVLRGVKVCLRGNLSFYERSDRYGYHRSGTALITPKAE